MRKEPVQPQMDLSHTNSICLQLDQYIVEVHMFHALSAYSNNKIRKNSLETHTYKRHFCSLQMADILSWEDELEKEHEIGMWH